jgi:hypothetical protein
MRTVAAVALLGAHGHAHHVRRHTTATPRHRGVYLYVREHVVRRFGVRAAGRDIVRDGLRYRRSTDREVVRSTHVMERMLHPVVRVIAAPVAIADTPSATSTAQTPITATPAPASGLEACIIAHESGGDSQAVNGQYSGIGQWSPAQWAADGGTAYGQSPLDASAAEQQQILASEGTAGMQQQQGQYDGC